MFQSYRLDNKVNKLKNNQESRNFGQKESPRKYRKQKQKSKTKQHHYEDAGTPELLLLVIGCWSLDYNATVYNF